MIRKIAIWLFAFVAVVCVALFAIASTRPDTYHVERSIQVAASPAEVHALVDDLHRFPEWSPWQKLDPAMTVDFSGPATGVGSSYHWAGNDKAGEGRMTITESTPPSLVAQKLEFIKPFASEAEVRFVIEPAGEGTKVTWNMDGRADFMTKLMSLFASMDAMIGKDFEAGLTQLRTLAESEPAPAAAEPGTEPATH